MSSRPAFSRMVKRSSRVWVGCCPAPSPALMTGRALARVAKHERVGIARHDADGVGERLALLDRGGLHRAHVHGVPAEAFHRRIEAHLRPRRGLEEEQAEQLVGVAVGRRRRVAGELGGPVQHRLDVLPRQLFGADEVVVPHLVVPASRVALNLPTRPPRTNHPPPEVQIR
jgi:hypothetical protein